MEILPLPRRTRCGPRPALVGYLITYNRLRLISIAIAFDTGPYKGAKKEPDYLIRPEGLRLPTFTVESGWTETMTRLQDDLNLLLVGGNGDIKVVLVVKWTRNSENKVKGTAHLYGLDRNAMPVLKNAVCIFPPPSGPDPPFSIKRRDLFGPQLLPGRNGSDDLVLDVGILRRVAANTLNLMGLDPA